MTIKRVKKNLKIGDELPQILKDLIKEMTYKGRNVKVIKKLTLEFDLEEKQ